MSNLPRTVHCWHDEYVSTGVLGREFHIVCCFCGMSGKQEQIKRIDDHHGPNNPDAVYVRGPVVPMYPNIDCGTYNENKMKYNIAGAR